MFRDNIRQFADEKVRPLVKEMDEKGVFDKDLIHQFFQLGLMGIEIPEQYGGGGGKFFEAILAVEEMSRVDASAGVVVDVQNTLVNNALLALGQRGAEEALPATHGGRYLRRLRPERSGFRDRTPSRCRPGPRSRAAITSSMAASCGSPMARKLASLCCLPRSIPPPVTRASLRFSSRKNFPGFTVGKKEDKLGIRASSTCELILEDCQVPKSNVLGEVGKGYKIAIETLNEGRIGIGAQMAGVARGAWEYAARYAQERKQFGKPISEYQGIQFQIAQMATEIEAARLMVYNAARMKDAGMPFVKEAAMTKLFCSQVAERVTSLAIEIYGGYGFTKDYPVEKYWRDSKIGKIYEGTSNMQLATIAKLLMGGK